MSAGHVEKRVVIIGAPAGHPATPPGGYPEAVRVEHVDARVAWTPPLPALVVGWLGGTQDVPAALDALRSAAGGGDVPVVAVMPAIDAALVVRMKALGVKRILMVEEMDMNRPAVVRAAA